MDFSDTVTQAFGLATVAGFGLLYAQQERHAEQRQLLKQRKLVAMLRAAELNAKSTLAASTIVRDENEAGRAREAVEEFTQQALKEVLDVGKAASSSRFSLDSGRWESAQGGDRAATWKQNYGHEDKLADCVFGCFSDIEADLNARLAMHEKRLDEVADMEKHCISAVDNKLAAQERRTDEKIKLEMASVPKVAMRYEDLVQERHDQALALQREQTAAIEEQTVTVRN